MCIDKKKSLKKKNLFRASLDHISRSFEVISATCVNFSFPIHFHAEYTIGMVQSGQEKIWCRGISTYVGAGNVYFSHPDEAHAGIAVDKEGWSYTSVYIAPAFFAKDEGMKLGSDLPTFTEIVINDPQIRFYFLSLIEVLQNSPCQMEKYSKLLELLNLALKKNSSLDKYFEPRLAGSKKISLAKEYMQDNFQEPVTLTEVAGLAGLHPRYFIEAFQKIEGITPHAYLVSQRINAAKQALLEGFSPTNVAVECGFYDQSHMNRHFNKIFGVSPGKFQKIHRELSF